VQVLYLIPVKKVEERKVQKKELRKQKVVKRKLKISLFMSAQVLKFSSSCTPDCYPCFGAKFCLGLIATLAS